jgi:hypothetical protein
MEKIRKRILKIHGTLLVLVGLVMTVLVTIGRLKGFGIFKFLQENQLASIGFFEAFLLAAVLGLFLRHASTLENVKKFNLLAALIHVVLATANIIYWDFYKMVDGEIPGTIATIGHFIFISVEGWAGLSKKM